MHAAMFPLDAGSLLKCTRRWAEHFSTGLSTVALPPFLTGRGQQKRLRVGYISSNLQSGAVFHVIQGLWREHASLKRVDLFFYATTPLDETKDSYHELLHYAKAVVDVSSLTHKHAALRIREDDLGVAVNINGWTEKQCNEVCAESATICRIPNYYVCVLARFFNSALEGCK